ncbi:hypothetical protein DSO57_1004944 [Entomophthora muscae]|uniref:Uncharacterized protein n=1 Tax=Entomophthora muscae TaxID=34485 RepID=A0ACC2T801_9FUNG|nr:hypothetical protein DSO57_1004944 [Entomophthora muscae]
MATVDIFSVNMGAVAGKGGVATKSPSLPANISYNTQGALDELSHVVSNNMDQPEGKVKLWALSSN